MATGQLRTANYPEERRNALGEAVASARRAAGYPWRTNLTRAHDAVNLTSLTAVELGKPGVGQAALEAIGRALAAYFPGKWSKDTPRAILEGEAPPDLSSPVVADDGALEVMQDPSKVGTDEWLDACAQLLDGDDLKEALRIGLEIRKRRRELADFLRRRAQSVRPDGSSDETSRVD